MAFGKKKIKEDEAVTEALGLDEPLDDATTALFAAPAPEAAEAPAPEQEDAAAEAITEPVAEEVAAAPDPLAGDDLLNMFSTTELEEDDRSMLLSLAGDVALGDLVDDLQTIATALGVKIDRESYAA